MNIISLDSVDSTNNWLAQHEKGLPSPTLVYCFEQTAGRGQRGNSWESEPGKNITASILFHPHNFPAVDQFFLSEAISLAISDFLKELGISPLIKWPNDIYAGDKKISGILVEHVVTGKLISRTIAGFGININQTQFFSDAPNPVSLSMLTGKKYDIPATVSLLSQFLEKYLDRLSNKENLHNAFLRSLWRKDNSLYVFFDRLKNERIRAAIESVATDGILTLITEKKEKRNYAFKEVEYIL